MKDVFCLALALGSLGFLFSATAVDCQDSSPTLQSATLPDEPSAMQATTCTQHNGRPCPAWLHKLIGQYPPLPETERSETQLAPARVHFWTYRGGQDPPLRSNREVFHSKLFLAAHIGGAIAFSVACRTKNSGETWRQGVPAVAAIFGMDYLQFRFVGGPNAIGPPVYEMIHYGLASVR